MCGRFTARMTWDEIVRLYRLTIKQPPRNVQPRYNICPTDPVDVVVRDDGERMLAPMRWGLIPNWWSKPLKEMKVATFNARAETVAEKPMFRESFERRRCLIPASGYYEKHAERQAALLFHPARRPAAHLCGPVGSMAREAGRHDYQILHHGHHQAEREAEIHDRMPVILEPKDFEQWEKGA